jgi:hypothetical protein
LHCFAFASTTDASFHLLTPLIPETSPGMRCFAIGRNGCRAEAADASAAKMTLFDEL